MSKAYKEGQDLNKDPQCHYYLPGKKTINYEGKCNLDDKVLLLALIHGFYIYDPNRLI